MSSADLMGGYAAYTTPNAAIAELASTGVAAEVESTPILTATPWTETISVIVVTITAQL
ncbi:hypothetical protein [Kitasatospora sp. SUK 42]|uniref:hypothetical protein n=1 Tax=Kitasatospora sp. SUK 42 TaxID=1588882 RepID=UPI0018CB3F79|nr:hypothetical protein [Kitasatospora sp. SUK 42]MBV2155828.1 hypothetical protein [Kitasatospora sp. SUK 42]